MPTRTGTTRCESRWQRVAAQQLHSRAELVLSRFQRRLPRSRQLRLELRALFGEPHWLDEVEVEERLETSSSHSASSGSTGTISPVLLLFIGWAAKFPITRTASIAPASSILTEGTMRIAYPGALLAQMGHTVDDSDAFYLYETRMAVVWPMDENGLVLVGEDSYISGDGFVGIAARKLALGDIAPAA